MLFYYIIIMIKIINNNIKIIKKYLLQFFTGLFNVILCIRKFPLPKSHDFLSISFTVKFFSLDWLWIKKKKSTQIQDQLTALIMSVPLAFIGEASSPNDSGSLTDADSECHGFRWRASDGGRGIFELSGTLRYHCFPLRMIPCLLVYQTVILRDARR